MRTDLLGRMALCQRRDRLGLQRRLEPKAEGDDDRNRDGQRQNGAEADGFGRLLGDLRGRSRGCAAGSAAGQDLALGKAAQRLFMK